jgi:TolB-like protein/DNA-binding winged helix-turn-helix (wHTH) protein/Tfp pilus assembly protein PilF
MTVNSVIFRFDNVTIESGEYRVLIDGESVTLEPKAFQVLVFLLERRGRLVPKDEILDSVWKDSFVTPNALTRTVAQIRRALGDGSRNSRYIETVPTRGYRFIANVEEVHTPTIRTQISADHTDELHLTPQATTDDDFARHADQHQPESWRQRLVLPIAVVLSLTIIFGLSYFLFTRNSQRPDTVVAISDETIAVLPFKLINSNDDNSYLSVGLADSLITKLSNVHGLTVRPTGAVLRYVASDVDVAKAGRDLNVSHVINGAVQRDKDRVRVTVQMIRVADGKPVWAESYDTRFIDIFQVQDEISARVIGALQIRLSPDESLRVDRPPTNNIDAYQSFLQANAKLSKVSPDNLNAAIEKFGEAITLDPGYSLAYAKLANAYSLAVSYNVPSAKELAEKNALKAIEIDPNLAEAHTSIAVIQFWGYHDIGKGQDSFVHSLELNPNSSYTHLYYGWFLIATGHFDEAERHIRRALELDPTSQSNLADQGLPFYYSRRYEEARRFYQRSLEINEKFWYGHARLAEACEALGDADCALNEIKRAAELSPLDPALRCELVRMLVLAGKKDEAAELLTEITSKDTPYTRPYFVALAYTALGNADGAFAALDQSLHEQDNWIAWMKVDPRLDPLRGDARFEEILLKGNFK